MSIVEKIGTIVFTLIVIGAVVLIWTNKLPYDPDHKDEL